MKRQTAEVLKGVVLLAVLLLLLILDYQHSPSLDIHQFPKPSSIYGCRHRWALYPSKLLSIKLLSIIPINDTFVMPRSHALGGCCRTGFNQFPSVDGRETDGVVGSKFKNASLSLQYPPTP